MLQMTSELTPAQVLELNRRLAEANTLRLEQVRALLWGRRIAAILKRGRLRNDEEYHLVKGAVDDGGGPELNSDSMNLARRLVDSYG